MDLFVAIVVLAAAAIAEPEAAPISTDPRCPRGAALVYGPPAAELFDRHTPQAGRAVWCERYDLSGKATRIGLYTDRHPSGAPRSRARFEADQLDGEVVILHENGRVWLQSQYAGGELDGPYVMFGPNGVVWLRAQFRRGVAHGRHVLFHPDGQPASETFYERGVEHGISRAWWPNGHLRTELNVVQGVWSGRFASYFETGRTRSEGEYAPCPQDGETKPAASCEHIGAARHGRWRTWHENGERASQGSFRFGKKVGTWVYWNREGQPDTVNVHRGDELVERIRGRLVDAPAAVSAPPIGNPLLAAPAYDPTPEVARTAPALEP